MNTKRFGTVIIVISLIIIGIGLYKYNSISQDSTYNQMSGTQKAISDVLTNNANDRLMSQIAENESTGKNIMLVGGLIFLVGFGIVISSKKEK